MPQNDRPFIRVSCAIIEKNGLVLAARRGARMSMPLKWEFPGGKIEPRESPEECLKREILEELGIQIQIVRPLDCITHAYPSLTIALYPFICAMAAGMHIQLHEHDTVAWVPPEKLPSLDWAAADVAVLDAYHHSKIQQS